MQRREDKLISMISTDNSLFGNVTEILLKGY